MTDPNNSQASYYSPGFGTPTNSSISWYWNDPKNASETVTCAVTLTPPAGQGSAFTVTATTTVAVQVPKWAAYGIGGFMQVNGACVNQNGAICLYAGPKGTQAGGINVTATLDNSTTPPFGTGSLELVQTVTPNESYTTPAGVTHPYKPGKGLDTGGILTWTSATTSVNKTTYMTFDDPYVSLVDGAVASAAMQHSFTDYLMYQPPGSSQWVPRATFVWSTDGSVTLGAAQSWADYVSQHGSSASAGTVSPASQTNFTSGNTFPSWTQIDSFQF